jgi:UDP-N-acetylglucosamine/UDP-N-acetylgalactosamine diphosphorylase
MIKFDGYDEVIERVYRFNQEHVFKYWDKLLDSEKIELLKDLSAVNFQLLKQIYSHCSDEEKVEFSPAPFIPIPVNEYDKKVFDDATEAGKAHIKDGKVAAFLVAGGQGSRLGYDGPKGKFPIGPVSGKTLFHFHAEKIKASEKKYGTTIPFLIMTSRDNHTDTEIFFKKQNFFGLDPANVHLFPQTMIPSLDLEGKLILSETNRIFMNPDGHGGSLTALRTSGALKKLQELKIETLSYFQVDNPLVKIIDPVFIGFHVMNQADISSKALKKLYPEEKTGIFVQFSNGTLGIVEYSDMPEDKIKAKDTDGEILYSAANPAIHLFSTSFVSELTNSDSISLPFHVARKKITAMVDGKHSDVEGFKFEKFVFDALPLSAKNVILEVLREEEFAPVKNASGQDSADSAKALMTALNKKWLAARGIQIPAGVKEVEISPLTALSPEDLPAEIMVPDTEKVLIS